MKKSELNKIYLARDVFQEWERKISEAKISITIYSPFFDNLIFTLLKKTSLSYKNITIITDFKPASLLELPNQLNAIKSALTKGISVLSLSGIHAKVLLIDDNYVTIGSQNFTDHARKSKECTAAPNESMEDTKLIKKLVEWREKAIPIDKSLVDQLKPKLKQRIRQHGKILDETQEDFDEIIKQHEQEKQNENIRRLKKLESRSQIRIFRGPILATITNMYGVDDYYYSLLADYGADMTHWIEVRTDGTFGTYQLNRLRIYPMIIAETYRMGFARIGKTRITYIRNEVDWTYHIDDVPLEVNISFPKTETMKRNIIATLNYPNIGYCKLSILFTGESVKVINKQYIRNSRCRKEIYEIFSDLIERNLFTSNKQLDDFLDRSFSHFRYAKLNRNYKNVRDYLKGDRFQLSIIQYKDNPFLVIAKHK